VKAIVILILIYLAFRIVRNFLYPASPRMDTGGTAEDDPVRMEREDYEETVLDPVCGSYVPVSSAVVIDEGGRRVCFCSEACRESYEAGGAQGGG